MTTKIIITIFLEVTVLLLLLTTAAAYAQESQKTGLPILGMNSFYDNNEFFPAYHIVGEVQNNSTETARLVQVSATLYDGSNQVVGTGFTYTNPSNIEPRMKAPFEIIISQYDVKGGNLGIIRHIYVQANSM